MRSRAALVLVAALLAAAPASSGAAELPPPPGTSHTKVLVFGIDGVRWANLERLLAAGRLPALAQLRAEGLGGPSRLPYGPPDAYTMSQVGWASIASGVWPAKHGVTTVGNDDPDQAAKNGYPDFLTRAEAARPSLSTMLVADWGNIGLPVAGGPIFATADAKRVLDADGERYAAEDQAGAEAAAAAIRERGPDLSFVYGSAVDEVAHFTGTETEAYDRALVAADAQLGLLLRAIRERREAPREHWTVIVTTDHGQLGLPAGVVMSHGGGSEDERTAFVIAGGPGVPRGGPVPRLVDLAPTVLHQLGLPTAPPSDLDGASFVSAAPPPAPQAPTARCRRVRAGVRCAITRGAAAPPLALVRAQGRTARGPAAALGLTVPRRRSAIRLAVTDTAGVVTRLRSRVRR